MTTQTRTPTRLFDVDEYYAMAEVGILAPDERVELIEGRIFRKYEGKPRLFNVDEYYAMAEAGILAPDERVELIDGEIIPMSPMKSAHAASVDSLSYELTSQLGRRARVRTQIPVRLNGVTEPEPDIAVVRWRDDFYAHAHPGPEDIILIIEVSDTTLYQDRNVKLPMYARFGIPQTWIANIQSRHVEIYDQPSDGEYRRSRIAGIDETLTLPVFDDVSLPVSRIFPE